MISVRVQVPPFPTTFIDFSALYIKIFKTSENIEGFKDEIKKLVLKGERIEGYALIFLDHITFQRRKK